MRIVLKKPSVPSAALYRAQDRDDALRIANQTSFGLSSRSGPTIPRDEACFIANLEAGAVFVNGMTVSYPELHSRHQGVGVRPRARRRRHPRVHQPQNCVEGMTETAF